MLLIILRRVGQPHNREVSGPRVSRPRWGDPELNLVINLTHCLLLDICFHFVVVVTIDLRLASFL